MDLPRLAIQIVNYRTRPYLERSLPSVLADAEASGLDFELSVLDNASGDRLEDLVTEDLRCRLVVAERNLGFGAGHNRLAAGTDAPYLLILNPDIELVEPHTARRLLEGLLGLPGAKVIGPRLIDAHDRPQPLDHGRLHGLRAQISYRAGHSYWRETARRQAVAWVSGAAMLVEHAAFESVGGFDESFFLYKEDEDLCLRIRAAGGLVSYEPGVTVRHVGSVVADHRRELALAERRFIEKHFRRRRSQRVLATVHRWLPYVRL